MSSAKRTQAPSLAPINIRNQVTVTHNSAFPFSSPAIDDHGSIKSVRTGNTALSQNPFESPNSSTTTLTDYESGATSDHDAWHLERYSEVSKSHESQSLSVPRSVAKPSDRSPGLQIITDFSKPTYHANNLVVDQVPTRQAETRANHARSVISQKGVKVDIGQSLTRNESSFDNKKQKRKALILPTNNPTPPIDRVQSQKSIVIGLCVPQHEANALQQQGQFESAFNLHTPSTPAIILTPPDERLQTLPTKGLMPESKGIRTRPISSVYSTITCSRENIDEDEDVPPLPALPSFVKTTATSTATIQFNKSTELSTETHTQYALQHQNTLSANDSCDTPRSQGWWNLLLSPLLSRHGSFASRKNVEKDDSPPPVPNIPQHVNKDVIVATPATNSSPETPRRLGLAGTSGGTWSNWADWERQVNATAIDDSYTPVTGFPGKEFPVREPIFEVKEGLAAEYYHACAIEQLTGAIFFECINHSCQEHLPRLVNYSQRSLSDKDVAEARRQSKKILVLGSPFNDGKPEEPSMASGAKGISRDEDESITDIESDDELEKAGDDVKHQKGKSTREILTPTDSENEPDELSPNVREANTAAFVKAKARGVTEAGKPAPKVQQNHEREPIPNLAAFIAGDPQGPSALPTSNEAVKTTQPGIEPSPKSIEKPVPALPMHPGQSSPYLQRQQSNKHQLLSQQFFMNPKGGFSGLPATPAAVPTFMPPPQRTDSASSMTKSFHLDTEKNGTQNSKGNTLKRKRGSCLTMKNIFKSKGNKTKKEKKRRRCCALCICIVLLLIIILCIVLATTITRKGDDTPVASRWLNLTGYPPMPVGISTIAQPDLAQNTNSCVQPATLWSCTLPKDDQESAVSNGSNTPDFRFEIKYRNGTTPANMNIPLTRRANDPFTNDLFTANPAPPNDADQLFLGNTTDNITAPFNGEPTPFYITFMSTYPVVPSAFNASKRSLSTRQDNLGINIPAPNTLSDGSAVPASLLPRDPFPTSQPVRLYNRGHDDEHYGFYIYYDKSIFLSGIKISGGNTSIDAAGTDADKDGGATKEAANIQCTWQQTRFLVKIFTSAKFRGTIFPGRQNVALNTSKESEYSSATDFSRPGSFPYPTSVAVDRHGGNINKKITYCYSVDKGMIQENEKVLVFEDRAAGGALINGAPSFVGNNNTSNSFDSSAGGIDGGTGGCGCTWQNWR